MKQDIHERFSNAHTITKAWFPLNHQTSRHVNYLNLLDRLGFHNDAFCIFAVVFLFAQKLIIVFSNIGLPNPRMIINNLMCYFSYFGACFALITQNSATVLVYDNIHNLDPFRKILLKNVLYMKG